MKIKNAKPFLKWAGGKGQLLDIFENFYPEDLKGENISKYVEPFVGAGAVLFDLVSKYEFKEIIINDINAALIATYKVIQNDIECLISKIVNLEKKYNIATEETKKEIFYNARIQFNILKKIEESEKEKDAELAALMIFLNRTCFNGLYRENKKGDFNVPFNNVKKLNFDIENLKKVNGVLKNATIFCGDFENTSKFIDDTTFVYADPPYRPLTTTSAFVDYTKNAFDDAEQERLSLWIKTIVGSGAKFMLSNSDPKNVDKNDNFFEQLYDCFSINEVKASRNINSKSNGRGKISELLISNV